jgi:hypothetical protein
MKETLITDDSLYLLVCGVFLKKTPNETEKVRTGLFNVFHLTPR